MASRLRARSFWSPWKMAEGGSYALLGPLTSRLSVAAGLLVVLPWIVLA